MKKPFTNRILGVNIAVTNMREVVNLIVNNVTDLQGKFICLSNVHTTVMSEKDEEYRSIQNFSILSAPGWQPACSGTEAERIPRSGAGSWS